MNLKIETGRRSLWLFTSDKDHAEDTVGLSPERRLALLSERWGDDTATPCRRWLLRLWSMTLVVEWEGFRLLTPQQAAAREQAWEERWARWNARPQNLPAE